MKDFFRICKIRFARGEIISGEYSFTDCRFLLFKQSRTEKFYSGRYCRLTAYEVAAPLSKGIISYSGTLADARIRIRRVIELAPMIGEELSSRSLANISSLDVSRTLFMSGTQLPLASMHEYETQLKIPLIQNDLLVDIPTSDAIFEAIYKTKELRSTLNYF